MNNTPTPTPKTDAAAWPETDVVEASFARQLETELAAVTEQLKETQKHLKDANRGAEINAHALRINVDKLIAVTEQLKAEQDELTKSCMRERLADEDRKHVENQRDDAFFQLAEAQEKLAAVTEQRDEARRLAEKYRNLSCQDQDQADATLLPWETNQSIEP